MIIKRDKSEIENYLVDSANYQGYCDAVYFPENESEICEIIKTANKLDIKVTVAGNGTGLSGACVPEGGIVIATDKLNKIIEINTKEKYAIVQPGVILDNFQKEIKKIGLFYPPDPTEQNCFVGATVATNASGAKSFKYGPTRNYVMSLKVVLPTGDKLFIERGKNFANGRLLKLWTTNNMEMSILLPDYEMPETKHSAGYYSKLNMDAIDLFIGSEGTLGIITEIKLKLLDDPIDLLSAILFFKNEIDSFNFCNNVRELSQKSININSSEKISARAIEYFDKNSLEFIRDEFPQIPDDSISAIWIEQEMDESNSELLTNRWLDLINDFDIYLENSWFATDSLTRQKLKDFRHSISEKVNEFIVKKQIEKIGTDTAVPSGRFYEYYKFMIDTVSQAGIKYICYGHIGDSHLHLNMLPKNNTEISKAKNIYSNLCKRAVKLGGTISAEHGIGKLKRDYLYEMYGEKNIKQMAGVKKTIDPNLILGIGNIIDPKFLNV